MKISNPVDDRLIAIMADELLELKAALVFSGLQGSKEFADIFTANPNDFWVVVPAFKSTYATTEVALILEPRRVYHALMRAGWSLANETYGRPVDGDWLATHDSNHDYHRPTSRYPTEDWMPENVDARFDQLLKAMANGAPPSARKKPSADPASGEASDACCSDTRTPKGTSADGDR